LVPRTNRPQGQNLAFEALVLGGDPISVTDSTSAGRTPIASWPNSSGLTVSAAARLEAEERDLVSRIQALRDELKGLAAKAGAL